MQVPLRLLPDPVPHVCETRLYFMALPPEYAASGGYRPAGLRWAPEWALLPAGCCFHVQNLRGGIPEPSVILPLSVEGSPLRHEPSMISTSSMEGYCARFHTHIHLADH